MQKKGSVHIHKLGAGLFAKLEETLESPLDCEENKPIHFDGNQPGVLTGRADPEDEAPILWPTHEKKRSLEETLMLGNCEGKRRRGQQTTRWLDSVIEATNMNLTQHWEVVEDRRAWHVLVHGITKSQT